MYEENPRTFTKVSRTFKGSQAVFGEPLSWSHLFIFLRIALREVNPENTVLAAQARDQILQGYSFLSPSSLLPFVATFLKTDPQTTSLLALYISLSSLIYSWHLVTTYNISNGNPNSSSHPSPSGHFHLNILLVSQIQQIQNQNYFSPSSKYLLIPPMPPTQK